MAKTKTKKAAAPRAPKGEAWQTKLDGLVKSHPRQVEEMMRNHGQLPDLYERKDLAAVAQVRAEMAGPEEFIYKLKNFIDAESN